METFKWIGIGMIGVGTMCILSGLKHLLSNDHDKKENAFLCVLFSILPYCFGFISLKNYGDLLLRAKPL